MFLKTKILLLALGLIVFGLSLLAFLYYRGDSLSITPFISPTPAPSISPTTSPLPSANPSESPTPAASPTATPESAKVTAMRQAVAEFETAYQSRNKSKLLNEEMVPPVTQDDKNEQSRLLKGQDLAGIPGGPTLFESATVSEVPTAYTISAIDETNTTVNVVETVAAGKTRPRTLYLQETQGLYLVSRYTRANQNGMYSGLYVD